MHTIIARPKRARTGEIADESPSGAGRGRGGSAGGYCSYWGIFVLYWDICFFVQYVGVFIYIVCFVFALVFNIRISFNYSGLVFFGEELEKQVR